MTDPRIFWQHTEETGEIICQLCCQSYPRAMMEPVSNDPEKVWDACKDCAAHEKVMGAEF